MMGLLNVLRMMEQTVNGVRKYLWQTLNRQTHSYARKHGIKDVEVGAVRLMRHI
jgi:hypothetical protein